VELLDPTAPAPATTTRRAAAVQTLVASLGRFSQRAAPGSSFDDVTSHLQAKEEDHHTGPVNDLIAGGRRARRAPRVAAVNVA
jgi:hypothetical protein